VSNPFGSIQEVTGGSETGQDSSGSFAFECGQNLQRHPRFPREKNLTRFSPSCGGPEGSAMSAQAIGGGAVRESRHARGHSRDARCGKSGQPIVSCRSTFSILLDASSFASDGLRAPRERRAGG
jgi:hypothetical protein